MLHELWRSLAVNPAAERAEEYLAPEFEAEGFDSDINLVIGAKYRAFLNTSLENHGLDPVSTDEEAANAPEECKTEALEACQSAFGRARRNKVLAVINKAVKRAPGKWGSPVSIAQSDGIIDAFGPLWVNHTPDGEDKAITLTPFNILVGEVSLAEIVSGCLKAHGLEKFTVLLANDTRPKSVPAVCFPQSKDASVVSTRVSLPPALYGRLILLLASVKAEYLGKNLSDERKDALVELKRNPPASVPTVPVTQ